MNQNPHEFVFQLDLAIRDQVLAKLEASPELALAKDIGPTEGGVYAPYWKGKLVYAGKASQATTKSKRTLRARLNEHVSKIITRKKISLDRSSVGSDGGTAWGHGVYVLPLWFGSGYRSRSLKASTCRGFISVTC